VKRLISVELLEEHQAVNYYAIRLDGDEETLFERFLSEFDTDEFQHDLDTITYWLDKIGTKGALERYFKPEGHPKVKAIPLPPPSSILRLYCFRISDQILLLGGGKDKRVKKYQEDPELYRHVQIVTKVGFKLLRFRDHEKVFINGKQLMGKLTFEIDL
jgi:hypothetical protein